MYIYPKYIKALRFSILVATIVSLVSCADDLEVLREDSHHSDNLVFTTSLVSQETPSCTRSTDSNLEIAEEDWALQRESEDLNMTRGSLAKYLSGEAVVMGFIYNANGAKTTLTDDNKVTFTFSGDILRTTGKPVRWNIVDKSHFDIFAYTPKIESSNFSVTATDYMPEITYTVPGTVSEQQDIIVSKWQSPTNDEFKNKTVPLVFDHALTAISLNVGFACTVKSVSVSGVRNKGVYSYENKTWASQTGSATYILDFGSSGKSFAKGAALTAGANTMILMPQTLPDNAKITLTLTDGSTLIADISGKEWKPGKLITYTLYQGEAPSTIYFDLALSNVVINAGTYSGQIWRNNKAEAVSGTHKQGNRYYVYQSTESNRNAIWSGNKFTAPPYGEVSSPKNIPWRDYIINNPDVNSVIKAWDINSHVYATSVGRAPTGKRIAISGNVTCNLTIDNIFSTYQEAAVGRTTAALSFVPSGNNAKVTVNIVGDNRLGAIHYSNKSNNGCEIIFEGTGSLTVADVDGKTKVGSNSMGSEVGELTGVSGYYSNHWCTAIGGNDGSEGPAYGVVFNSGVIFAGTTRAENASAIGGGGNDHGMVTINGGVVTAVATTTGTAIGGGLGFNSAGGTGNVTINGGNVYAYNHANKWKIPSSAIGGAGSYQSTGSKGTVTISGGYVYAESALGTAIGGGSSYSKQGGSAVVNITGGQVIAKTKSPLSTSIGGGTAFSNNKDSDGFYANNGTYNGGDATITISGNPIIRTGSIGGGGTGDTYGTNPGHLGNATITISGGDIQAQFILAAGTGAGSTPTFTMNSGMIRNSNTGDTEYYCVKKDGGAVYLENGNINISGGSIQNCVAERGGAIYISGGDGNASLTMTGGEIYNNESSYDGGAIYMSGGNVTVSGGNILNNLSVGGNGGGLFIEGGSFSMSSANICDNSAGTRDENGKLVGGNGGAVYISSISSAVDVELISGTITGNTSNYKGGGVCVDMYTSTQTAKVIVGTENGDDSNLLISGNLTLLQGGGLYARGVNADITINSGTIMDNTVSGYTYNQNVANELGTVTLNGGNVTHNVVTFNANDGKDIPETSSQNIVTSTNSKLVAPTFHRTGYNLVGWNTKPNGTGDSYTNGQTMNINKDITLYAQWEIAVQ